MSDSITGGCHCGAVRYTLGTPPMWAGHCQCTNCQKFSSAGHISNMVVAKDAFEVSGELQAYSYDADSGNHMTRYVCPVCATPIYGESSANPTAVVLRAGSLDDASVFDAKAVIYTDSAVSWDAVDTGLPTFPKMPQR